MELYVLTTRRILHFVIWQRKFFQGIESEARKLKTNQKIKESICDISSLFHVMQFSE